MDPVVWGPHYWFFLHTMASNYPKNPTSVQKKIHYRLVHNMHEFIPHRESANLFSSLLAEFPVAPYLDTREDLVRWVHMIHNKVNAVLEKPAVSLHRHKDAMKNLYAPTATRLQKHIKNNTIVVYVLFVSMLGLVIGLNR
jgi:hypothetical protein